MKRILIILIIGLILLAGCNLKTCSQKDFTSLEKNMWIMANSETRPLLIEKWCKEKECNNCKQYLENRLKKGEKIQ